MPGTRQQRDRHMILTSALTALQSMGVLSQDGAWLDMILDESVASFLAGRLDISKSQASSVFQDLNLLGVVVTKRRGPQKPLINVKADVQEVAEADLETLRQRRRGGGGSPPSPPPPPPPPPPDEDGFEVPEGYVRVDETRFNEALEGLVRRLKGMRSELEQEKAAHAVTLEELATAREELAKPRGPSFFLPLESLEFLGPED